MKNVEGKVYQSEFISMYNLIRCAISVPTIVGKNGYGYNTFSLNNYIEKKNQSTDEIKSYYTNKKLPTTFKQSTNFVQTREYVLC